MDLSVLREPEAGTTGSSNHVKADPRPSSGRRLTSMPRMDLPSLAGWSVCTVLLISPYATIPGLYEFADLPQSVTVLWFAVLLLQVCTLSLLGRRQASLPSDPITLSLLAFLLWTALSLLWATNRGPGVVRLTYWCACAVLYSVVADRAKDRRSSGRVVASLLFASVGVVLLGMAQHLFSVRWIYQAAPPASFFGSKNMAAEYLVMVLPLSMVYVLISRSEAEKILAGLLAVSTTAFIIYTETRSSWLALLVLVPLLAGALAHGTRETWRQSRVSRKVLCALIVELGLLLFLLNLGSRGIEYRLDNVVKRVSSISRDARARGGTPTSPQLRLILWRNSIEMFRAHPLAGVGIENFSVAYPLFHRAGVVDPKFSETAEPQSVHNEYLQVAVESGIVGIFLYGGFLMAPLWVAWKIIRSKAPPEDRLLTMGLVFGVVAFLVTSFFSFPLRRSMPPMVLCVYAGLVGAMSARHVPPRRAVRISLPLSIRATLGIAALVVGSVLIRWSIRLVESDRFYQQARVSEALGQFDAAARAGLRCHEQFPFRLDGLSIAGASLLRLGEPSRAIPHLEEVIRGYPFRMSALLNLGAAHVAAGSPEDAVPYLLRVLELKPDHARAHFNLGQAYRGIGDREAAARCFAEASRLSVPDEPRPEVRDRPGD